jgi:hypothetical protein
MQFLHLWISQQFFTEQGHLPCVQSPTRRTRSLYLCLTGTGWPSYTPKHRILFFVASCDSQAYCGGILTRLLMRTDCQMQN